MDASLAGVVEAIRDGDRQALPPGAAPLVDLAAKWMRDAGLVGPLAGGSLEFTFDTDEHVNGYFAKTRGGRRPLEPVPT